MLVPQARVAELRILVDGKRVRAVDKLDDALAPAVPFGTGRRVVHGPVHLLDTSAGTAGVHTDTHSS